MSADDPYADVFPVPSGPTVLTHPSGATFVVGTFAPDDEERMLCKTPGAVGHSQCGVHLCCGWPKFLICPDDPRYTH